jgi:peptide/nickel transport system substrate-binding protein
MSTEEHVDHLVGEYLEQRIDRRSFFRRAAVLGIGASTAAAILAACGSSSSSSSSSAGTATAAAAGTPKKGGQLIEGYDRDFSKNDPVLTTWDDPAWVAIYEFPLIRDAQGAYQPALFSKWDVSSDLLTWTFTMPTTLTFQSGAPVTNQMIADNFNIFRDPNKGQNAIFWPSVKDAKPGPTPDTVVVTMKTPFTAFPETLATENSMIVNLAKRAELGDKYGVTACDGTGPFTQTTFTPGTEVVVTRWDGYKGSNIPYIKNKGPAYLDSIKWVPILDVGQRANEIETGGANVVKNPAGQDVDRLKGNSDLVTTEFPALANYWISLDCTRADYGFDNLAVRQAISHAIDREGLVKALYFGHAAATYGPIAPNYKWYDKGVEQFNQFDPDKAKSMLDAAGWTVGSDGTRAKGGKKLSWVHYNYAGQPTTKQIDEAVQAMLKKVGVDMQIKTPDEAAFFPAVTGKTPPASWGFEWLWSSPVDLLIFFHAFPTDAYNGAIPEIKAAVTKWQTAPDNATLEQAARDFQLAWAEKLPKISLLTTNNVWVAQKKVMNYTPLQSMLYPMYNDVWLNS